MNTSEKGKSLTPGYSFIQGFFWMNFAAIMGFSSIYLLECGYTNTQIGMIIAIAGALSAGLQPAIASYADKPDSLSLKKIILLLSAVQVVLAILLLATYQRGFFLTGLFYGCLITILQLLTPLVNALGTESMNQGKKLNFGVARGMGSAAYAVASYALGIIVAGTGARFVPISIIIIFSAMLVSVYLFSFEKVQKNLRKTGEKRKGGVLAFFMRYKRFSIVLIGCVMIYISHVLLNNFTFQIVESKGGGSPEMGFSMALSALIELPTLFLFTYMLKKIRCDIWFRISGIFFMLKSFGTLLAPNIPVFYGVQIFQMLGWALITVASVYYVNSIMDEQDAIKGQAYITMTYTLGSVIGALLGGKLIDFAGVNSMLAFGTVCAAVGMVILLIFTERS